MRGDTQAKPRSSPRPVGIQLEGFYDVLKMHISSLCLVSKGSCSLLCALCSIGWLCWLLVKMSGTDREIPDECDHK